MASATQTVSTSAISLTHIQNSEVRAVAEFLTKLGLPALPIAPLQDPYRSGQHKKVKGDHLKSWAHCPLTKDFKPEPLYTGKNPSFLHPNGKPQLVRHQDYQKRLPNQKEIQTWWKNPTNGIGTLGGWSGYIWIDFDLKQFESQEECDRAFHGLLKTHPQLRESWWEQTHSGGWRLAVKPKKQPDFTNFALEPGGKHRGEALGKGRFTVLAPTIGVSGNPYRCCNRAVPVEVESLEAIGIYPLAKQQEKEHVSKPQRPTPAGAIALEQLGNRTAFAVLQGDDCKGDRSASIATAYKEWAGWERWASSNGIYLNSTAGELAHQAGEALGVDGDRVDRIIKTINPSQCQPAALHCGGEEDCWKRIRKIDRATFEAVAPQSIRESLEALYSKKGFGGDPPSNRGNGGNGGSGGNGDDRGNGGSGGNIPDDNPDAPFKEICEDFNLPFEHCVTRQQFDGSAYRSVFGGEQGDWTVINSAFYHWSGRHWECKTDAHIHKILSDYGQKAFKVSFDRDGNPYITRPYENNKHKESAFKYCRSRLEREILTTNAHLLGFSDCVVDLRTGQTMAHDKEFLLTNIIPHDYQPNSECPEVFSNFIAESFGEDMLEPIRAFTSMMLDPTAPYGRFPHLIGKSGGGKGTLGRFWSSLFGIEGAGSASNFSDLSTPEGRHQYLTGKRIFAFPDVGGYSQGLRAFYELIDNGSMTGRALFSPVAYSKLWNCRFWVASVDHLQVENAGDGWARRAYLIPVKERTVAPDPDLRNKLEAVKAQVISWALAMPRAERDAILLSPPASDRVKSLTIDAALYGDSTRSFVDLCLRPSSDVNAIISHSQLHTLYVAYCQQHGYTPLGQSKFIAHLRTVLPRNYADRAWSPQVDGVRSRIPAHWKFLAPLPNVFVSSGGGSFEFPDNPQWVCIKSRCVEGGIEEFEDYWSPKTLEPLHSAGVHPVHPGGEDSPGVDSLKPLHSEGVHPGSSVHTLSSVSKSEIETPQFSTNLIEEAVLDLQTLDEHPGQGGQPDTEQVSGILERVDTLDTLDKKDEVDELPPERLKKAIAVLKAVNSLEAFKSFYNHYQKCPVAHQDQIVALAPSEVQARFYEWLSKLESSTQLTHEPVKPVSAKWLVVNLQGTEQTVKFVSQKGDRLTVRVSGFGEKTIMTSQVIRVSGYTGD